MAEILSGVLLMFLGGVQYQIRSLKDKITREEAVELIDLKQEALKQMQQEIKEDTIDIKRKLDKLDDYLRK